MKVPFLLPILLFALPLAAQVSNPDIRMVQSDPAGTTSCSLPWQWNIANGNIWYPGAPSGGNCTWTQIAAGGGGGLPTATAKGQLPTATGAGTTYSAVNPGVINVRTIYGAVPDGSTDNSTTIAAAFMAANAVTTGSPTVYFDCNGASSICQYNYGGSGTSPINPTIPMTIECASGTILNYTGTAHAVDVQTTYGFPDFRRYQIKGCTFTGGASYTEGIYLQGSTSTTANSIAEFELVDDYFLNFGNTTGATLNGVGNNWTIILLKNYWLATNGNFTNMVDFHLAENAFFYASENNAGCIAPSQNACSVSGQGYGFWLSNGYFVNNQLLGPIPAFRMSSESPGGGQGLYIVDNDMAANTNVATAAIEIGDPGGPGNVNLSNLNLVGNSFYWPAANNVNNIITLQTPASAAYSLGASTVEGNLLGPAPQGTGKYLFFGNKSNAVYNNNGPTQSQKLDFTNTNLMDSYAASGAYVFLQVDGAVPAANLPIAMDSNDHYEVGALYHGMGLPLKCTGAGNGTAQTCTTNPQFNAAGSAVTPVAGDCLIASTSTTNTGAMTLAVNGASAAAVQKLQGTVALTAGDWVSGHYTPMCFDGTVWDLLDPIVSGAHGIQALTSGTATVSNAAACTPSATCVYKLTNCGLNGSTVVGVPSVGTVSVGTSFVINSLTAIAGVSGDTSNICWQIN